MSNMEIINDGDTGSCRCPKGSGGDVDAETSRLHYDKLIGVTAACGVVIKGISNHALERFVQRGISCEKANDVVVYAPIVYPGNTPGTICQQKDGLRVVINENTGNVITAVELEEDE